MASKQYFRVIQTFNPDQDWVRTIHQQKLNNYAKYHEPWTDEEVGKMPRDPITGELIMNWYVPDFEIKHVCQSGGVKDYIYVITTTLCCEDKEEAENY